MTSMRRLMRFGSGAQQQRPRKQTVQPGRYDGLNGTGWKIVFSPMHVPSKTCSMQ